MTDVKGQSTRLFSQKQAGCLVGQSIRRDTKFVLGADRMAVTRTA